MMPSGRAARHPSPYPWTPARPRRRLTFAKQVHSLLFTYLPPFPYMFAWDGLEGPKPKNDKNPYPPPPHAEDLPPLWYRKYWPVFVSVASFFAGLGCILVTPGEPSLSPTTSVVYLTLMSHLPLQVVGEWFKRGK